MPAYETLASIKARFGALSSPTYADFQTLAQSSNDKFTNFVSAAAVCSGIAYVATTGAGITFIRAAASTAHFLNISTSVCASSYYSTVAPADLVTIGQSVSCGGGLTGGGTLSESRTVALAQLAVGATTYPSPSSIVIDKYGRVTSMTGSSMVTVNASVQTTALGSQNGVTFTGSYLTSAQTIFIDAQNVRVSGTDVCFRISFGSAGGLDAAGHSGWWHNGTTHTQSNIASTLLTMTTANVDNTDYMSMSARIERTYGNIYMIEGMVMEVTAETMNWFNGKYVGNAIGQIKIFAHPATAEFKAGSVGIRTLEY